MNPKALIAAIAVVLGSYSTVAETELTVALFPYLPAPSKGDQSNEKLRMRLESEFKSVHPGIKLNLRKFDPINDDFYNPRFLASLLEGGVDLIEIDTVLLGSLLDLEVVAAWPDKVKKSDWNPIARDAVTVFGRTFGVPHWMCGHFVMSPSAAIAAAGSLSELREAFSAVNTPRRDLVGDLTGSWNSAAIYIDAWQDSRTAGDAVAALEQPVAEDVLKDVVAFARCCDSGGENPCTAGRFRESPEAAQMFARGEADALFGYSERLFFACEAGMKPEGVFIGSAPIGEGNDPLWFVDALVMRVYPKAPSSMTPEERAEYERRVEEKRSAGLAFAEYLNSPSTFAWIHGGEDLEQHGAKRYLIPATKSAFESEVFSKDPIMRQIRPITLRGTFFPRAELPGLRRLITKEVQGAWK